MITIFIWKTLVLKHLGNYLACCEQFKYYHFQRTKRPVTGLFLYFGQIDQALKKNSYFA